MCSSHCIASIASSLDEDEDEVVWGESVPLPPPAPLIDDERVPPPVLLLVHAVGPVHARVSLLPNVGTGDAAEWVYPAIA